MDTEAELARLAAAFFAAVSFEEGGTPGYDAIRDLFIDAGLLIRNTGDAPEVTTVDAFIAPRAVRLRRPDVLLRGRARGGRPDLRDRRPPLVHV
jgi:hypothetical protein